MEYSSLTTGQLEVWTRTPRPTNFANQRAASQMSYLNSRRAEGTFVLISLGAAAAGWKTAFIARPGNAPLAVGAQPLIQGADLDVVAQELIRRFAA